MITETSEYLQRLRGEKLDLLREQICSDLLERPSAFSIESLAARGWSAVMVAEEIDDDEADSLEVAVSRLGVRWGLSISTEPLVDEVYRVRLTSLGFNHFDASCMLRCFLLIPESDELGFAILNQGNYFHVVAGPPAFLGAVFPQGVAKAREEFVRSTDSSVHSPGAQQWLKDEERRYRALSVGATQPVDHDGR